MATLTATLDTGVPDLKKGIVSGTFATTNNEGSGNGTLAVDQLVLGPTSTFITSFNAECQDGPGTLRVKRNVNSAETATNGTVLVESNDTASRTYQFTAHFLGS